MNVHSVKNETKTFFIDSNICVGVDSNNTG